MVSVAIASYAIAAPGGDAGPNRPDTVAVPGVSMRFPASKAAALDNAFGGSDETLPEVIAKPPPPISPEDAAAGSVPAHIVTNDIQAPASSSVLDPVNGWISSDGVALVGVFAGVDGLDPANGRVVVIFDDSSTGSQRIRDLVSPNTGALQVEQAPHGQLSNQEASAAVIVVVGEDGSRFSLDLASPTRLIPID